MLAAPLLFIHREELPFTLALQATIGRSEQAARQPLVKKR